MALAVPAFRKSFQMHARPPTHHDNIRIPEALWRRSRPARARRHNAGTGQRTFPGRRPVRTPRRNAGKTASQSSSSRNKMGMPSWRGANCSDRRPPHWPGRARHTLDNSRLVADVSWLLQGARNAAGAWPVFQIAPRSHRLCPELSYSGQRERKARRTARLLTLAISPAFAPGPSHLPHLVRGLWTGCSPPGQPPTWWRSHPRQG